MNSFYIRSEGWIEKACAFHYDRSSFRFSSGIGWLKDNFYTGGWPYEKTVKITQLIGAELIIDNVPVSKFARAAVGTLVFGALGTIAGLVSGATARPKAKISVALQIDDIDVASFTTRCDDIGTAYRLLNTLAQMEKEYYKEHLNELKSTVKNDDPAETSSSNNSLSEEIMKFKNMLDEGIIDQDEFKELKKNLINRHNVLETKEETVKKTNFKNVDILKTFLNLINEDEFEQAEKFIENTFSHEHNHYIYQYTNIMFTVWKNGEDLENIPSKLKQIKNPTNSDEVELLGEIINTRTSHFRAGVLDTLLVEVIHFSTDNNINEVKKILDMGADPNLNATFDFSDLKGIKKSAQKIDHTYPIDQAPQKSKPKIRQLLIDYGAIY
jgi:hypothetical protein